MDKIERIKELVLQLSKASTAYYKHDNPIMTDQQYDNLYDELELLEKETGVILSNSPTQKVQGEVIDSLQKVTHTKPMLSAQKTKSIDDIVKFVGDREVVLSYKMDGLTLVIRYDNGKLIQAITRGTGDVGEDVTHAIKMFTNVPLTIPYKFPYEVRGEGVISWENFNTINESLPVEERYKHPRNLAAGSVRNLNSNITKSRFLEFIAFDLIDAEKWDGIWYKKYSLHFLNKDGFDTVEHVVANKDNVKELISKFDPKNYKYPVDGVIAEYDDLAYGVSLGKTAHHENRIMALKWQDELSETSFRGIELNPTRTGMVSLTALFDDVEIDGTTVNRASVHNVDIFEAFEFGIGDSLTTYKANQIIPQIAENLTRSNTYKLPMTCPCCGSELIIKAPKDARFVFCTNDNCPAKLVQKFVHFCSKPAFNIEGLSESTLEKFIAKGWIKTFYDIYNLDKYKNEIIKTEGFGARSYEKMWDAIQNSRDVKMDHFIVALGIPQIGKTASKTISKYFNGDWFAFEDAIIDEFDFTQLEDFGQVMNDSIYAWYDDSNERQMWTALTMIVNFIKPESTGANNAQVANNCFAGLKLYCTGSFASYKKDALKEIVESHGGEFASGYAKSLDMLVVGSLKGSGKEDKARTDGVRIVSEDEFLEMIGEKQ